MNKEYDIWNYPENEENLTCPECGLSLKYGYILSHNCDVEIERIPFPWDGNPTYDLKLTAKNGDSLLIKHLHVSGGII